MGAGTRAFILTLLALVVFGGLFYAWVDRQTPDVAESTLPPRTSGADAQANETANATANDTTGEPNATTSLNESTGSDDSQAVVGG